MPEEAAKIQILAGVAGKITRYAAEELIGFKEELGEQRVRNRRQAGFLERIWKYYK
jgi:hypothetical protein